MQKSPETDLVFYNSLTRKLETFKPINSGEVKIYSCGPTVYDFAHIGNYRSFLFSDLLHRVLKLLGYQVKLVMNLTDIDDKTIRGSQQQGKSLDEFTAPYITAFKEDLASLNILPAAHYPRATDHIAEMEVIIDALLEKGYAYQADGSVYFRLSSFKEYGKLSNLKFEKQIAGASNRVLSDEYERDEISDFVLWKKYQSEDGGVFYESRFGKGRPGWHIECSAMSEKYLGTHFDIHTGGIDNKFPHHENEIAQSVCASGHDFVNYWLHASHLLVDNQKMSKSLGNFYTLRDLLNRGIKSEVIRFMLISSHYRHQFNFSLDNCEAAEKTIQRVNRFGEQLHRIKNALKSKSPEPNSQERQDSTGHTEHLKIIEDKKTEFLNPLKDDLNVSAALASVFELITALNPHLESVNLVVLESAIDFLERVNQIFAVFNFNTDEAPIPDHLKSILDERAEARLNKDFAKSDELRDKITTLGYTVLDKPQASTAYRGQEIFPL